MNHIHTALLIQLTRLRALLARVLAGEARLLKRLAHDTADLEAQVRAWLVERIKFAAAQDTAPIGAPAPRPTPQDAETPPPTGAPLRFRLYPRVHHKPFDEAAAQRIDSSHPLDAADALTLIVSVQSRIHTLGRVLADPERLIARAARRLKRLSARLSRAERLNPDFVLTPYTDDLARAIGLAREKRRLPPPET
jgi:hypothetical protein